MTILAKCAYKRIYDYLPLRVQQEQIMATSRGNDWPTKGGKNKKMFSGSAPPGPHVGLKNYAVSHGVGHNEQIKGSAAQGQRHQSPNGIKR